MSELRQCPFCGGEASVYESNRYPSSGNRITGYTVICTDMDCINYRADDWYERTEKRAIERWNTRAERTCHYFPDSMQVAFDENDEEIETGETDSDGCDYTCDACGFTMLGGEEGWFDEAPGEYGGWDYKARFNYCPNCGAKVVSE